MSLRKFLNARKEADVGSADLLASMTDLQERMARRMEELVASLDTKDGAILQTPANAVAVDEIMAILRDEFGSDEWTDAISDYLDTFDGIADNVLEYANTITTVEAGLIIPIRRQYKSLVAEYLTSATAFSADLWIPMYQQLSGAVANGGSVAETIASGRLLLLGDPAEATASGAIAGRAATTVSDLTSIYERTTVKVIADEMEAAFFLYQGSEIATTREFCAERHDRVWHRQEIEDWAHLEWAGKIPETTEATIFTNLGGYQCRHILLPLALRDVPSADLARMRAKGLV